MWRPSIEKEVCKCKGLGTEDAAMTLLRKGIKSNEPTIAVTTKSEHETT